MKAKLQLLLAAILCAVNLNLYAFSGAGSGTPEEPYVITSAAQLTEVKNDLNAHYKLGSDIDLTDWITANSPTAGWEPIGFSGSNDVAEATPFRGSFDGDGHAISGLWINRPDNKFVGLFGQISGETAFKNLSILIPEGKSIKGNENTGAIGGWFTNADATNFTTISNVFVNGKIEGAKCVGALIGLLNWTGASVENCYATGDVISTGDGAGGLVGSTWGNLTLVIDKCYAINSVAAGATFSAGGIFGAASANNPQNINITISNSVAANPTVDGATLGRILGFAKSGAVLTFIDNQAFMEMLLAGNEEWFGESDNKGGADITGAALALQSSYPLWDFDDVWKMGNEDYQLPVLKTLDLNVQPKSNPAYLGISNGINNLFVEKLDVQYAVGILNIPNKAAGSKVEIYSVTGKLVLSGYESSYNLSSFVQSVYLVKTDNRIAKIRR
jgi:hypothetical protein